MICLGALGNEVALRCLAHATTPTTPREVKLTAGRTIAVWVSAPAVFPTTTPWTSTVCVC